MYKAFCINNYAKPINDLQVNTKHLHDFGINVVSVGETGRNRVEKYLMIKDYNVFRPIRAIAFDQTRSGRSCIISVDLNDDKIYDKAFVQALFPIGFRGSNEFHYNSMTKIVEQGTIAQGDAGRMGSGCQYILLMDRGAWFYVKVTGRTYDNSDILYYYFDGKDLLQFTNDEDFRNYVDSKCIELDILDTYSFKS